MEIRVDEIMVLIGDLVNETKRRSTILWRLDFLDFVEIVMNL